MQRARAAAAELAYDGDAAQVALAREQHIRDSRDPAGIICRMTAIKEALVANDPEGTGSEFRLAGMDLKAADNGVAGKLSELIAALAGLPVSIDPAAIVQHVPTLLNLPDIAGVLQRRVAALQSLRPQLDVERMLNKAPGLLIRSEEACRLALQPWAARLEAAAGAGI